MIVFISTQNKYLYCVVHLNELYLTCVYEISKCKEKNVFQLLRFSIVVLSYESVFYFVILDITGTFSKQALRNLQSF